jgi:APA family basic amino acid/polyamine antiporter
MTSASGHATTNPPVARNALARILGLGFGIAVIFGGTVGVGILRLPGVIAAQLGSVSLILLAWVLGGVYALLGAISLAELGAAMPQAGGFYIYAKRAFGSPVGFALGWADWLNNCAVVAFGAIAAAEYIAALFPKMVPHEVTIGLMLVFGFCAIHLAGLRLGSTVQKIASSLTALTFLVLAVACLLHPAQGASVARAPGIFNAGVVRALIPIVGALRAIVVTYDGWYEAIYFTEEDTDAGKHLPRAMIGGVVLVIGLYLLLNLAFLHVLSMPVLATSKLPAADAARIVFPAWSGRFVTVLSLLTLLSLINAVLLGAPRILLAIGRDGLFTRAATRVGAGGTPWAASLLSAGMAALLIASGKFEDIISVAAILVAGMYCVNYVAVIVLRVREPQMPRPFHAWGYPVSTGLVLLGSLAFLVASVHDDRVSVIRAGVLLAAAIPAYMWMRWRQRGRAHA